MANIDQEPSSLPTHDLTMKDQWKEEQKVWLINLNKTYFIFIKNIAPAKQ